MTPRPTSFEPLASSDPVPGDSYEVAALGKRLTDTAAEIETQVASLRKLAEHSTEFWTSKAAGKFHDSANDLAGRIEKAHGRYATTGHVLTDWSSTIDEAQSEVYPAVADAQAAELALQSNAPQPAPPAGSPPPTAAEQATTKRRAADHTDAQTALTNARNRFEAAVGVYNKKAKQAADAIGDASSHDGLKDSWWDRNFHWIATVMKLVAIAIIVLAVIAIIIACPLSAGVLLSLGATEAGLAAASTAVEIATAALLGGATIFDTAAAATGKQSWTAAILDYVAVATFGFGELAKAGSGALASYGGDVGKAVAAGRAGRSVMGVNGLPKVLWSIGQRVPGVRPLLSSVPRVGRAFAGADSAAAKAAADLETALKTVPRSNIASLLTQSEEAAKNWGKVNAVVDRVPGVLRLTVTKVATSVLVGSDALAQTTVFGVTGSFTGHSLLSEWFEDHELEKRLDAIVERWSHPLVRVP